MARIGLGRPAAALAVTAIAIVATAGGASAAHGWSQGGFNGAKTGYNTTEHTLSPAAVKHLTKKWSTDTGVSTVAALGKRIYEARGGGIVAVRASNGHKLRTYKTGGDAYTYPTAPVISHKVIYTSQASTLMAIKISDGKRSWSIKEHDHGAVSHQWSYVTVDATGKTIIAVLRTLNSTKETNVPRLEGISAATGKVLWSQTGYYGPVASAYGEVFAQGVGKSVGPGSYNHTVAAFDVTDGSPAWSAPTEFATIQIVDSIAVTPSTVLVTCGGSVSGSAIYGLSRSTGATTWSYNDADSDTAPGGGFMVTDGTNVAYLSGTNDLVTVRVATGKFVWRKPGLFYAVGADGVVYTTTSSDQKPGRVLAYQLSNGKLLWRGPRTYTYPTLVAAGRLVTQDSQGAQGSEGEIISFGTKH